MNYAIVRYIIGYVLLFEAGFMVPPLITAIIYQESSGWSLAATGALCALFGLLLIYKKPKNKIFYTKEGFVTVALSWIVLSIMGSLPFLFSGSITNPVDALFETVSGFTTTGASIIKDVESLPKCILFWRSFTHWIGGMGVLVLATAILPSFGIRSHYMTQAESPGPVFSKLVPKQSQTSKILYGIYCALTVIEAFILKILGMPL